MGNKAAYIHLRGSDLRPQFHQFTAVVSLPPSLGQSGEPFWGRESGQWGLVSASGAPRTPSCPSPTAGPFLCLTLCLWFCITVFSAPNYCDQMGNKAAYIHLRGSDLWPQFHQFTAVPHPDVKPMAYASTLLQLGMM